MTAPLRVDDLLAALRSLDRRLEVAVAAAETLFGPDAAKDPYRGLHISRADADRLLDRPGGATPFYVGTTGECWRELAELSRRFGLSPFETDVLLIAIAPEIDLRYERLYGYLQDDVTKRRPSVDLVLSLLCPSLEARLEARRYFAADGPLLRFALLRLFEDPAQLAPTLLGRSIKVDDRIVDFVLGVDALDQRLRAYARYTMPERSFDDIVGCVDPKVRLGRLIERLRDGEESVIVHLRGPRGVGKKALAEACCRTLGTGLLVVDGDRLLRASGLPPALAVTLVMREAALRDAVLYWDGFDDLPAGQDGGEIVSALVGALEERRGLTFLGGGRSWGAGVSPLRPSFVMVDVKAPTYGERLALWNDALAEHAGMPLDVDVRAVAAKYRLTGGHIHRAARTAWSIARGHDPNDTRVTPDVLDGACSLHSHRTLNSLLRKVTPHYSWDDIILPADRLRQLREVCNFIKYRAVVYEDWGFDRKLSLGKGINVLFVGPSGTGKTMAAEIMASELGAPLYKIDLASVVSKYIGETEKNLARIFDDAEETNAILFFDEADALLGRRSEVRDSHDRYANIETSYLLQRIEEYRGVVILATNFRKNMDEAFVRRLHSTVEFPFPGVEERRRIWEALWPPELPRSADIDLDFVARRLELSGGNIRNVALSAAFLAADDGGRVTMDHVMRATLREYQKLGKLVTARDFGAHAGALATM